MKNSKSIKVMAKASAIADCTSYIPGISIRQANSGSVYVHYPRGKLRVSNHISYPKSQDVKWELILIPQKQLEKCSNRKNVFSQNEINKLVRSIKEAHGYGKIQ